MEDPSPADAEKKPEGTLARTPAEIAERWVEHFSQELGGDPSTCEAFALLRARTCRPSRLRALVLRPWIIPWMSFWTPNEVGRWALISFQLNWSRLEGLRQQICFIDWWSHVGRRRDRLYVGKEEEFVTLLRAMHALLNAPINVAS